ncbi:Aegerolysin-domain-containing protein, partial [Hygrophoropsis aurantiaca]
MSGLYGLSVVLEIKLPQKSLDQDPECHLPMVRTSFSSSQRRSLTTICNFNRGKFHQKGNPDVELSPEEIDKIVIPPGSEQSVSSRGRSDSAAGVEGTIDLCGDATKICAMYWNYPWGPPANDFEVRGVDRAYIVTHGPLSPGQRNVIVDVAIRE